MSQRPEVPCLALVERLALSDDQAAREAIPLLARAACASVRQETLLKRCADLEYALRCFVHETKMIELANPDMDAPVLCVIEERARVLLGMPCQYAPTEVA